MDDHDKNNVIGEFLAKVFGLVLVWFFVAALLGIILEALHDDHGDFQAKGVASVLVVWLFFQIDKWVANK